MSSTCPPVSHSAGGAPSESTIAIGRGQSFLIFSCFAKAYFFSYGLRSVNAALAPFLIADLGLSSTQLGWLSSAFFVGLAGMQLPLGGWLDRYGARRTEACLLGVAALGSLIMVWAEGVLMASLGRALIGCGVAASLMAPYSYFRRCYPGHRQAQLGMWVLVAGTCGAAFFTTPAAIVAAHFGWRSVHLLSGTCMALIAVALWLLVPDHDLRAIDSRARDAAPVSNWRLVRHPDFARMIPLSLLGQGGAIALQTLWAGPWLTDVLGMSPAASSTVLLVMMACMVAGYFLMGLVTRPLQRRFGMGNVALVGYAASFALVLAIGLARGHGAWVLWPLLALSMVPISLMQTYVSLQFPRAVAGRVVSLYNMFIFVGAFGIQWAVGFGIDAVTGLGTPRSQAFAWMLIGLAALQFLSLLGFMRKKGTLARA